MKKVLTVALLILLTIGLFVSCNPDATKDLFGDNNSDSSDFMVKFNSNGGTSVAMQIVQKGKTATKPANPEKDGFNFDNWYSDEDLTEAYNFDTPVTADITLYAKWNDINLLSGTFTVNVEGKKVLFTKGNLYWNGDTDSFGIEDKQWDYQTEWNPNHVSHFYWSKTKAVAYSESYGDGSASENDILFTNDMNDISKPNPNFKVAGETGKYRSLSKDEWTYLLNTRTVNGGTGDGKSFQRAFVNSVYGLIIYPDNYTEQTTTTTYTSDDWSTMEAAGCAFIPASGYRDGSSLNNNVVSPKGYVLTASSCSNNNEAFHMEIGHAGVYVYPGGDIYRYKGISVRLVVDKN